MRIGRGRVGLMDIFAGNIIDKLFLGDRLEGDIV
jgi:hypothetical protein